MEYLGQQGLNLRINRQHSSLSMLLKLTKTMIREIAAMLTRMMTAGALLLAFGSVAMAQDTSQPTSGSDQTVASAQAGASDIAGGATVEGLPQTGFEMRVGKTNRLKVDCGNLVLSDCIAAAQPLLDRM